jgi:hypothetical protein
MRENIRSGRRANFYITENNFIDHYAKAVGPMCAVVYNVLERYMNSETRSTWVGTAKIAEVVGATQRTVQRNLKTLEEFKLIRILKTASATTYVVLPVPARPREATVPLFDAVDDQDVLWKGDTSVADATQESFAATEPSYCTTPVSRIRDTGDSPNKEEQNLLNKTTEQETSNPSAAPSTRKTAEGLVQLVGLPVTFGNVSMVEKAVVAEASHTGRSVKEAFEFIGKAALEASERGVPINKYWFEDAKWRQEGRSSGRFNRAEQRKLDNLEVNARVQQRIREKFGHS